MQESVTLYFKKGGSDKVYTADLKERGEGYAVDFAYGRRGSTMQTGTKTSEPVPYPEAKKIYDRVVKEKQAKGYIAGLSGVPYQYTGMSKRITGILPQLLNPIEEKETELLLDDPQFWMQEKLDGQRVLILKQGNEITGVNRKGLAIGLTVPVIAAVRQLNGDYILDGEAIGETYCAFDLLASHALDLRSLPFSNRWESLRHLITDTPHLRVVPVARESASKRRRFSLLKRLEREGVVFKRMDSPYAVGRPNSGGTQLKFKFYATASLIVVAGRTGKRSIGLELLDRSTRVKAGNVTIPASQVIPVPGTIVEVRYLYAFRESGHLYQPVFIRTRNDLAWEDCTVSQLKYRSENQEEQ